MRSHWAHIGVVLALLSALTLANAQSNPNLRNVQNFPNNGLPCNGTGPDNCNICYSKKVCAVCDSGYFIVHGDCIPTLTFTLTVLVFVGFFICCSLCMSGACDNCCHAVCHAVCEDCCDKCSSASCHHRWDDCCDNCCDDCCEDCCVDCCDNCSLNINSCCCHNRDCLCALCVGCWSSFWCLQQRGASRLMAKLPFHRRHNEVAGVVSTNLNQGDEDKIEIQATELSFVESRLQTINGNGTVVFLKREGAMQSKKAASESSDYGFLYFEEDAVRIVLTLGSAGVSSEHIDRTIQYVDLIVSDVLMKDSNSSYETDPEKVDVNGTVITSDAEHIAKIKRMFSEYKNAYMTNQSPSQNEAFERYPMAHTVSEQLK